MTIKDTDSKVKVLRKAKNLKDSKQSSNIAISIDKTMKKGSRTKDSGRIGTEGGRKERMLCVSGAK